VAFPIDQVRYSPIPAPTPRSSGDLRSRLFIDLLLQFFVSRMNIPALHISKCDGVRC
jgi:hypothetical protein